MGRGLIVVVLLGGCGRIAFDELDDMTTAPPPEVTCATVTPEPRFDAVGAGTPRSPYILCTADQLVDLMQSGAGWSRWFALGADLELSGRDQASVPPIRPIGSATSPFTGDFAGHGHAIRGFTLAAPTVDDVGLFGRVEGTLAAVHDVRMLDANVTGNRHVGALVGWVGSGAIVRGSSSSGTVRAMASYAGGLIGAVGSEWSTGPALGSLIYASSSSATVRSEVSFAGGLIGHLGDGSYCVDSYAKGNTSTAGTFGGGLAAGNTGVIMSSFATGNVDAESATGGLVGSSGGVVIGSFATGNVTGKDGAMIGLLIGEQWGAAVVNSFSNAAATCTTTMAACHGVLPGENAVETAQFTVAALQPLATWSFDTWSLTAGTLALAPRVIDETAWGSCADHEADAPFAGGLGTLSSPYLICTQAQLSVIGGDASYYGAYRAYALMANLDLVGTQIPIGDGAGFRGFFDGRGHTIANLTIDQAADDIGFFTKLTGHLRRLGLVDVYVRGWSWVGTFAGTMMNGAILDSYATGQVVGLSAATGGLIGDTAGGTIARVYFAGTISSDSVGGVVGDDQIHRFHDSFGSVDVTAGTTGGPFAFTTLDAGNYYDMSRVCTGCTVTSGMPSARVDLYDPTKPPLATWDFANVWQANAGQFPTLR